MNKSVKSYNHSKSLPCRQAGVIQTFYDIVKAYGGELLMESKKGEGTIFIIELKTD